MATPHHYLKRDVSLQAPKSLFESSPPGSAVSHTVNT